MASTPSRTGPSKSRPKPRQVTKGQHSNREPDTRRTATDTLMEMDAALRLPPIEMPSSSETEEDDAGSTSNSELLRKLYRPPIEFDFSDSDMSEDEDAMDVEVVQLPRHVHFVDNSNQAPVSETETVPTPQVQPSSPTLPNPTPIPTPQIPTAIPTPQIPPPTPGNYWMPASPKRIRKPPSKGDSIYPAPELTKPRTYKKKPKPRPIAKAHKGGDTSLGQGAGSSSIPNASDQVAKKRKVG